MIKIEERGDALSILADGLEVARHSPAEPLVRTGEPRMRFRFRKGGRFAIRDRTRLEPLDLRGVEEAGGAFRLSFRGGRDRGEALDLVLEEAEGLVTIRIEAERRDRAFEIALRAGPGERVYGCGERFTKLDLRGELARIWVEEHIVAPEVARKLIRLRLGLGPGRRPFSSNATYYPQPSFVSSAGYFCHVDCDLHGEFDFRAPDRHLARFMALPDRIVIGRGKDLAELVGKLSGLLGRPPALPSWAFDGMIIGAQGGSDACEAKTRRLEAAGAAICGIWAQDWEGERITYFGKQLRWDWRLDEGLYPGLRDRIRDWGSRGVAFLGYVNPYLCEDGELFAEAAAKGFLALDPAGKPYLAKTTSFPFGLVDLTNPGAYAWLKGVIKENMLGLGMRGWMADFGEYLPTDAVLAGGSGLEWHQRWPLLWARLNREAVEEAGALGEALFFVRSGWSGVTRHATMLWAGDQHVDWSPDYGLGSALRACLSLAMSGAGACHADIGGYTTFPPLVRGKELFLRWLELGAFMPLMRSHEGNRPGANWQFDSDAETIAATARFSRLHAALRPYFEFAQREYLESGLPMMRPLFLHYGEDFGRDGEEAFLLGRDLAVYPVLEEGAVARRLRLPRDRWIGLFDGLPREGGEHELPAPVGSPPAFYRAGSAFAPLFASLRT